MGIKIKNNPNTNVGGFAWGLIVGILVGVTIIKSFL
ncbi:hypothetical protein HAHI6034_05705 [Hathewaya histolytica]|uniref:Uncharacterized protein n=1 Tax=Hathewaya histolytica TaxID=1498 RepID=A0A4U9RDS3_HATHI|nr:Uncharacterised protein [Hathewaya histolytica]